MKCTCPHHYGRMGLEKFGTDARCPVHGAPRVPNALTELEAKAAPFMAPRPQLCEKLAPVKWCLNCGTEHAKGIECPDYD